MRELYDRVGTEVGRAVVGAEQPLGLILSAAALGGHVLLEGPPGTAKTLLAHSVARAFDLPFRRIQFTPDMLPSDVTGNVALLDGELTFRPGPLFASIVLADEINRTPPKTQAAMLEAMEEHQVTVDGQSHDLGDPFVVLATQNPIEQEGTYPLPEAQLDRFLFRSIVGYPSAEHERAMLDLARDGLRPAALDDVRPVANADDLRTARAEVAAVSAAPEVVDYALAIARQTRVQPAIALGASPRAAVHLLAAARAAAALSGRSYVIPDDVAWMVIPVLAHRIQLLPEAALDNVTVEQELWAAMHAVPVPR